MKSLQKQNRNNETNFQFQMSKNCKKLKMGWADMIEMLEKMTKRFICHSSFDVMWREFCHWHKYDHSKHENKKENHLNHCGEHGFIVLTCQKGGKIEKQANGILLGCCANYYLMKNGVHGLSQMHDVVKKITWGKWKYLSCLHCTWVLWDVVIVAWFAKLYDSCWI